MSEQFDFDLLTDFLPIVRVGKRLIRLDTIEHVEYSGEDSSFWLEVSTTGGNQYGFSKDEISEFEAAIKTFVEKAKEEVNRIQALAAENQQLKQELARILASQHVTGQIVPPWGNSRR